MLPYSLNKRFSANHSADNVPGHWWSLSNHAHLATSYLCEAEAAIWEGRSPCGSVVCSWIGASYPVPPNFTHWTALKLCTALENFYKFLVKPENICTCAGPEVTHSFKQTLTLWHYIFSDATKSIVCLQERSHTRVARLAFLTPNFTNLAVFRGRRRQKNCFAFWLFSSIFGFFWRKFAHAIRLVSWVFNKDLAEKCYY